MESAAMVRCAHTLVRTMKEELAETRTVEPIFILLCDHGCHFIAFDPVLFNDIAGKEAMSASLRQRAAQEGARGALIGTDSYAFLPDLEAIRRANQNLVRAATAAGIDALIRSGLGRKSEAISVSLQTPTFHLLFQQLYTRGRGNSIVFRELLTIDSREYDSSPVISAGFFDIFTLRGAARA